MEAQSQAPLFSELSAEESAQINGSHYYYHRPRYHATRYNRPCYRSSNRFNSGGGYVIQNVSFSVRREH
jgi:hypothetical protein